MKMKLKPKKKGEDVEIDNTEGDSEELTIESDRITYHMSRKISDQDYGNTSVGLTYSSSVRPKEKLDKALNRVIEFTQSEVLKQIEELTPE